jgi:hypothetical protein
MAEVPKEMVESANAAAMEKHHFRPYNEITRTILQAAAPAIRKQERQRVREALRRAVEADEVLGAACDAYREFLADPEFSWDIPGAMCEAREVFVKAALDSLEDSDA